MNRPLVVPFVNRSKLLVARGMYGATGNIYLGLQEFEEMAFLLHYLRPGDTFIDVGANIGSYTVLASAVAGAKTIAFEPVGAEFSGLEANVRLNDIGSLVDLRNIAVGSKIGTVYFTKGWGAGSKIIKESEDGIQTAITTLDAAVSDRNIRLIKVDAEGFEPEVIKGAKKLLSHPGPLALIIEMIGLSGWELGMNDEAIHTTILDCGFKPFSYDAFSRDLIELDGINREDNNTLYLKGAGEIRERVKSAKPFKVIGNLI